MARQKAREAFTRPETVLPELGVVGTDAPQHADERGLHPHRHRGQFELCLIVRGRVEWWAGAGEQIYSVGPGDVYITRPDEPHGGVDAVLHPCELYWLTVTLSRTGRVRGMSRADGKALAERYHAMRRRRFPGSAHLQTCFEHILDEHRQRDAFSAVRARAALHELLITMLRDHDAHDAQQQQHDAQLSEPVRAAMQWMQQHLDEDFGLEAVAQRAGLGVSRLHERFRREVGFAPADWRTRQRIDRAKQMLRRRDRAITDIAFACGFNTSQYFATAFKRLVGLTPAQYRQQVIERD